jgi:Pex19 protein family
MTNPIEDDDYLETVLDEFNESPKKTPVKKLEEDDDFTAMLQQEMNNLLLETQNTITTEKTKTAEEALLDTMKNLQDSANQQSSEMPELDGLLSGFDDLLNEQNMEEIMSSIFTKEMVHEPMKELAAKYAVYLVTYKGNDKSRYTSQMAVVQEIVDLYEKEDGNQEKVMELMQKMQEFGEPPAEIMDKDSCNIQINRSKIDNMLHHKILEIRS